MSAGTNRIMSLLIVVFVLVTTAPTFAGQIIYVDDDASGAHDGSSWADAFNYLQDALAAAWSGDEIRVAQGIYTPDSNSANPDASGDREETFQLVDGVTLKGGYAGFGQPNPDARDVDAYQTVLSGDLKGDDGPNFAKNGENSCHVVTGYQTDSMDKTMDVLDGFTVTGGNADSSSYPGNRGGGMFCNSDATVSNCTFTGNFAIYGGGMYCGNSWCCVTYPTLTNCTFIGNAAGDGGGGLWVGDSDPTLTNCKISGNSAGKRGGGLMFGNDNFTTMLNCLINANSAGEDGGGIYGVFCFRWKMTNCTLTGNSAEARGGGIYNQDGSDMTLTNCILWGDSPEEISGEWTDWVTVNHSCIQGGWPGNDNIDTGPLFVDADGVDNVVGTEDDNLRLFPDSHCINAGDPNYIAGPNETDLDGNPRVICGRIDMGAYEFQSPRNFYVDEDAAGANDGSSWADAYNYLQDALKTAWPGDEIHVAQGTYKPDQGDIQSPGDRYATFQLINGVALKGGYAGFGEKDPDARDIDLYETILSGDLDGNDEPVDNPADLLADPNRAENSYHIVTGSGADETAILDGFTVIGGNADGSYPNSRGGGLFQCDSPISNCTISGNSAVESGGGLYVCTGPITNCTISCNSAAESGGGLYVCAGPITKCTISDNSANYGGGIYGGSLTIIDCIFIGNVSQSSGGGWDAPCNSRLINCLFSGNRTGGAGGAIFCPCTSIEMINCTVTGNVAEGEGFYRGGGICGDDDTDMFLTNCIFWGNRDFDGMIESSQIWQDYVSQTHVNHCCVQGWTGILGGSDNHGNNPRFVDPDGADNIAGTLDDNLRLQANSYCVNAGDNDAVPPSVLTDLDGNQRIFDGVVDQGAYENASTEPPQIAHWKLDESGGNIAEDSAWNHDGKLQGDPIWRPQCGRIAGALEFDGQGDYVNCGNDSNFNITGAITLAAWIKTESSSGKKTILAKHDDAWRIRIQNGNFELVLPGLSGEQWFTVSGSAVNDNCWHHVLGVYDGHSIASVYIDGSLDASREATGSLNTNDEDVCIGRNSLLPERDFVGRIDDVQVYDYALTDDEIADLAHPPTIYHVDAAATGEKNGFCWSDAFVELQSALATAESGDQIWMAAGSYLPDYDLNTGSHTGDRHASFRLQNDIVIQGGYAGYGAADPYERDIQKYETILSGDLMGNDTPGLSPENLLTDSSRSDNSWTVILANGVNRSTVLDGYTVYGGQADIKYTNEPTGNGGGIYMEWGNPTLKNCTFHANAAADSGGGILIDGGLPLLLNCRFEGNYCGWSGGGLCNLWGGPTLQGCRFENNYAGTGAGLYNLTYYVLTLDRCTFNSNVTTYRGGGIMLYEYGGQTILNNCLLTGNQAPEGGAIGCDAEEIGTLILNNCTVAENEAEKTGGGIFSRYRGLAINNCIFWANADSTGYTETAQIHVPYPAPNYTCVQGWTGQWPGIGNIGSAPFFVDPINGDYHLLTSSPCIDAGDPNHPYDPNETDLDGEPRVIGGRIDMGAYEYRTLIPAEARIAPRTINLASKGNWITCYIWLPDQYNVADIDPNSIFLENEIEPERFSVNEQQQVATAKFIREDVQPILEVGDIKLKITGRLMDGTVFEATDIIKVTDKAGKKTAK